MSTKSNFNNKRGIDITKYFFGGSSDNRIYTNARASNNSLKIGANAENDFHKVFNFPSLPVSHNEQRQEHIDIRLVVHINKFKTKQDIITFEVKAAKRINRHDNTFDYDNITLELLGITGHIGWIFSKADYICFQIKNKWWLFVPPAGLVKFILSDLSISKADVCGDRNKLLNKLTIVNKSCNAINGKMYSRKDRSDLVTRYSIDIISKIPNCIIFNNNGAEQQKEDLCNNTRIIQKNKNKKQYYNQSKIIKKQYYNQSKIIKN